MAGHVCDLCTTQISVALGTGESGVEEEGQDSGRGSQGVYASTAVASRAYLGILCPQQ